MSSLNTYTNGANLGGWLILENWLMPNVPLLHMGTGGREDNQELDYIRRLSERGLDPVATMHYHWRHYLGSDLLSSSEPPPRILECAS
jgi:hypothetical protein